MKMTVRPKTPPLGKQIEGWNHAIISVQMNNFNFGKIEWFAHVTWFCDDENGNSILKAQGEFTPTAEAITNIIQFGEVYGKPIMPSLHKGFPTKNDHSVDLGWHYDRGFAPKKRLGDIKWKERRQLS